MRNRGALRERVKKKRERERRVVISSLGFCLVQKERDILGYLRRDFTWCRERWGVGEREKVKLKIELDIEEESSRVRGFKEKGRKLKRKREEES